MHALQSANCASSSLTGENPYTQMLEVPGQLIGKSEVRALLSALAIHPTAARFEALWGFLSRNTSSGKIRWVDFKECFDISEDISQSLLQAVDEEDMQEVPKSCVGSVARKGVRRRKSRMENKSRSKSAPPEDNGSSDDDVLRSFYDVTFSAAVKDPSFDRYSTWSPLGRRGYRAAPGLMRPMSVQSEIGIDSRSPGGRGRSVHFRTRDIACQIEEGPSSHSKSLSNLGQEPKEPTLTPFSNLRNGSKLKMQWRRWTGGETRQPHKSSNEDPAAPGATASLLLGAGEFQTHFQRNLGLAKSLETILQNNPGAVFDMDGKGFKSTSPHKALEVPSGENAQQMQNFVQAMFPTGLSSGSR